MSYAHHMLYILIGTCACVKLTHVYQHGKKIEHSVIFKLEAYYLPWFGSSALVCVYFDIYLLFEAIYS